MVRTVCEYAYMFMNKLLEKNTDTKSLHFFNFFNFKFR